jgi:hypothetical protein
LPEQPVPRAPQVWQVRRVMLVQQALREQRGRRVLTERLVCRAPAVWMELPAQQVPMAQAVSKAQRDPAVDL